MRLKLCLAAFLLLSGCVSPGRVDRNAAPVAVKIIGINDFHGALEPPKAAVPATAPDGAKLDVPAGGAAYLASAIARLREGNPNNILVSAGDLISASPLVSSLFLDEPTVLAMNRMGLDLNAVGNHEFDRGRPELLRMQNGGCAVHTARTPCAVDPDFPGARFGFLAANVRVEDGSTLFPSTAMRSFGRGGAQVHVGFIGLTLKSTATLVAPGGVAGLRFDDEADSINALVPKLKADGADAVVVLIHQGLSTKVGYDDKSCGGIDGDLLPILARLDPRVDLVVSGHTHNAYVCDYRRIDPTRPMLVTSAGRSGVLVSDITLSIDPAGHVLDRRADNVIVQGEGYEGPAGAVALTDRFPRFPADPGVAALVARYVAAAAPITARVVGQLDAPALRKTNPSGESVLGNLLADSHLAATRPYGAQIAFTGQSGVRTDVVPAADGSVTYGQLYTAQPFGNTLVVKGLSGRQIRAILEQQFESGTNTTARPMMLLVSRGFTYKYDLTRPAGQRIVDPRLNGVPLQDEATYRVTTNNFLAAGGDNFTAFRDGTDIVSGPTDLEALEAYLRASGRLTPPTDARITRLDRP